MTNPVSEMDLLGHFDTARLCTGIPDGCFIPLMAAHYDHIVTVSDTEQEWHLERPLHTYLSYPDDGGFPIPEWVQGV